MEAIEEVKMIEFFEDPLKAIKIGSSLDPPFEHDLINFLQEHSDVFAWEALDMQGISPKVMVHRLNVHPEARPIKQKKRAFETDRNKIIKEKWKSCSRSITYDQSNIQNGWIDAMIDSTSGCELMSFLDAFQGYPIRLAQKIKKNLVSSWNKERTATRSSDKGLLFFKVLKKVDGFSWTEQCQATFEDLKKYLASPPLLTKPRPGETLFLYLVILEGAIRAVLERSEVEVIEEEVLTGVALPSWKDGLEAYLKTGTLPQDPKEARAIQVRAGRFTLIGGELYKRGFSQPYLKCISQDKVEYVLREIYEGSCGNHSGGRALASKALRQGYFWPTMRKNTMDLTRLEEAKGNWVEELPGVLWAYRTTPRRSTRESPFSLVYGTEAIVPVEIGEETLKVQQYEPTNNGLERQADLDLIQELRNNANTRTTAYKAMMAKAYNSKVRRRGFQVGDLVLRRADAMNNLGKLNAKWEGPYQVTEVIGSGTYKLQRIDGKEVPRTWNIANLKKYFV
ncbi:UNVERIFIED_CONTAM: hypothetical protein Slati_3752700 [Sesamum latifolium]|uniref:Uncharacterized protein n=1 Tax=Sesamum latifolium TaxID=2727402 RepID=A0AAW2U5N9_9LAMI